MAAWLPEQKFFENVKNLPIKKIKNQGICKTENQTRCLILVDSFLKLEKKRKKFLKNIILKAKNSDKKVLLYALQNDEQDLTLNRQEFLKRGIATCQNKKSLFLNSSKSLKKLQIWYKIISQIPEEIVYFGKDNVWISAFVKKYFPFTKTIAQNISNSFTRGKNIDSLSVNRFGDEWKRFDQPKKYESEQKLIFSMYFAKFPKRFFCTKSIACDFGCGSGRWSKFVAGKVRKLYCLDPSLQALAVAKKNLQQFTNCHFVNAGINKNDIPENSLDFGFCLGVLHHMPDPLAGLRACVKKLKPGAPLLIYFYQNIAVEPKIWFFIHCATSFLRVIVSRLPIPILNFTCETIAAFIYWPLARFAKIIESFDGNFQKIPLYFYRNLSFYTMRTDARDRFGTPLENRKNKRQLKQLMESAGLEKISFNPNPPFWTAYGIRKIEKRPTMPSIRTI